jgi:MFS transporter, DHA1 family, tetracycline resistance protein
MFNKKNILLFFISLVGFIDVLGLGLVYPMFASMLFQGDSQILPADASDGFRGTCLGILLATMPTTQFFSAPILGMLSDQKGRRKVLLPALAIGVFGYLIGVIGVSMENFFILLLSRVAIGISAGTAAVVGGALADISSSEDKAKNFGLFNMACGLGFTAGPFIGGMLSGLSFWNIEGYALPFALAGFAILLNLIFAYFFFEETYTPKTGEKLSLSLGLNNIKKAIKIPGLQIVFLAVFLACVGWSFYWEFTPVTWINLYGFDTTTIGNFYAYGAAVFALSSGLLIRPIVNRFPEKNVLCFSLILCGSAIGMLLFHESDVWLWLYIPIQQFAIALFWPTAAVVTSNSVSEDMQGEIMGVLQSVDSLAFSVSPLIAGPLLGISASMPIVIGQSTMFIAALILGIYLWKNASAFQQAKQTIIPENINLH